MRTSQRRLWHQVVCGGTVLATLATGIPAPISSAFAAQPQQSYDRSARRKGAPPATGNAQAATDSVKSGDTATVRLTCLNASWAKVLRDLAEESGSTLVMDKSPPGRFSRMDREKYSRTEAVRILNRELEPKGFRIVEKDKFLVVLALDDVRSQYRRPVVRDHGAPGGSASSEIIPAHVEETDDSREAPASRRAPKSFKVASQNRGDRTRDDAQPQAARNSHTSLHPVIRQAAVAEGDIDQNGSADAGGPSLLSDESADSAPAAQADEVSVVDVRNGSASKVAKVVYGGLKERSELLDSGPDGLPAFRTFRAEGQAPREQRNSSRRQTSKHPDVLFTVGIDSDQDQLRISAPAPRARQLAKLFREIDTAQEDSSTAVRVMSADDKTLRIGQNLRPQLARLIAQRGKEETSDAASPRDDSPIRRLRRTADDGNENLLAQEAPNNPGEQPKPPGLPSILENLRGDVSVEALQDSGVLILRGNPKDVDAVMKVIKEIEKLSAGAAPEIHLHPLKHVNADSLALLLNSVYEKLSSLRTREAQPRQLISFISVVKPNSVLILAPPADMKAILQLVDDLDQPVDPDKEFQVFSLKYAVATQVAANLTDFYKERGGDQGEGLRTRISAYADVRTNSIIVQARPRDLAEIAALVRKLDRDGSDAVSKMQIFRLNNAAAEELANVINQALQSILNPTGAGQRGGGNLGSTSGSTFPSGPATGGPQSTGGNPSGSTGQSSQQLRDVKSVVLEFLAPDGNTDRVVRSGLLADVRVTADPRTNRLVVTAPEQSMQLMAELIRYLDQPTALVAEIKVYTLSNGDATQMVTLLQNLFAARTGQQQQQEGGVQLAGAEDPASLLVPLKFSVDARTNSVIVVGGADSQVAVEALITRLDAGNVRQRQNVVVKLKNSYAPDVSTAINDFLRSQRELAQIDPDLVSSVEFLEREIIAVPEAASNSLLISATPRYFEEIQKIVARLDEAPPQVIIQAMLVEVDLQNTDEFGVELGFQDSVLFDRSILDNIQKITQTFSDPSTGIVTTNESVISSEATPGFQFNNNPLGKNPATNSSKVGKQSLSNFSLGRVNNDLGYGGLVLSAGSESVSVLLRALAAQRTINVLSRPQIRTLDNQEATIQVGQQVPIVDGFNPGVNGSIGSPNIRQDDAGIILSVTPRISPDGTIVMKTSAQKSQFAGGSVPIFTDVNTGNTVTSPIKDITIANSTVSVPNGQTIVMGGMITKTDNTSHRKVPCLGDLPLIGRAFRFDSTTTRRTELLIFLTPRIIKNDEDNEVIKQVEAERIHFLEAEAEAIHGPLFGVSPGEAAGSSTEPNIHRGAVPAVPPVPNDTDENDDASIPTTIMPGSAFQLDEPRFLDAGTSAVSDEEDETATSRNVSAGAETPPARPKSTVGGKPRRLNRVVSSNSN